MMASMLSGPAVYKVPDRLLSVISNEYDAATYMAAKSVDEKMEHHVNNALAEDLNFKQWLHAMPADMPPELEAYQHDYPLDDFRPVDAAIHRIGASLSYDQFLFHGGDLQIPEDEILVTERPLSTTFCPQVALREADWDGKAYEANCICIYVLRIASPHARVFVFDPKASEKGNEKEVLFASGVRLIQRSELEVRNDFLVYRVAGDGMQFSSKPVSCYVREVDVY
ncbi:hypothetical protein WI40_31785 [Burkholderia ubonensis]|nr:hypothetical protein WI40_31785 [Burkholderia ubonensis]